jgi:regulatory protein
VSITPELRQRAIGLLARREHSRRELQQKLHQRGAAGEDIEQLLDVLQGEGLQSEQRFAESFVRSRIERGLGPQRIQAELRERGVDDELIGEALAGADVDWSQQAHQVRHKRFGSAPPEDAREQARQMRFLQYRGFNGEQIRYAMNQSDWD